MKNSVNVPSLVRVSTQSREIIKFRLTEDLFFCGSASAVEVGRVTESNSLADPDCCAVGGRAIVVHDEIGLAKSSEFIQFVREGTMGYARRSRCNTGAYEVVSLGGDCCDSSSTSDSSDSGCLTIPGIDMDSIPVADPLTVDYFLAIKDGCLVKVAATQCDASGASGV
ncbi:MAG: hypothetical protein R3C03_24185 [Pirellulaceae bacterium]